MSGLRTNIRKMYIIRLLRAMLLIMPVVIPFFESRGLTLGQVFLLQSIFSISVVLFEVPTGYIGDLFSRKGSLLVGMLFGLLGRTVYYLGSSFWMFALADIILALAFTFMSGSDSALLYDTLDSLGIPEQFKKIKGRYLAIANGGEAVAAILGSLIVVYWGFSAALFGQIVLTGIGILIGLTLIEPPREKFELEEVGVKHLVGLVRYALFTHNKISAIVLFSAVISLSTYIIVWLMQPYWELGGIPLQRFGLLWAIYMMSAGLFAMFGDYLSERVGDRRLLIAFPVAVLVAYLLLGVVGSLIVGLVTLFIFYAVRGVSDVVFYDLLNKLSSSKERATILSLKSLGFRATFALLGPLFGWIVDAYTLSTAFLLIGVVLGILFLPVLYLLIRSRLFDPVATDL